MFETGTSDNKNIITSYVNSGRPTTASYSNTSYIRCGYYTNTAYDANCTGTCKGFIYVNKLPTVPDGCVVTASNLYLYQTLHGGSMCYPELYTSTLSASYSSIETYLNNLTWNTHMNGLVYGGASTAEDRVALDYVKASSATLYEHYWDITPAVQAWYAGSTDISRLLVMDLGSSGSTTNARATYSGYKGGHSPQIIVHYQNTVGVEDIYSYHTQNISRAGTGYVNNFTLGLTLCNTLVSSPSEVTPFSLSLIYNTPNGKVYCTSSDTIHTNMYHMISGAGWKASVQQTVVPVEIKSYNGTTATYLVYMDADGTEHYFRKDGTSYKDEDGLNLTITTSGSTYTMTDKEKNTWEFYNGYLTKYTDNNGNMLLYAYDGATTVSSTTTAWKPANKTANHRVTSVWRQNKTMSSAVKIATLNYDTSNRLSTVVDQAGRTTTLAYTTKNSKYYLTSVTYPDGKKAFYGYDYTNSTYLTRAFDREANYGVEYSYTNQQGAKRVCNIWEYRYESDDTTIAYGQKMHAFKSNATYSRFRYYGADAAASTSDDIVARYAFDNFGRTVNIINMNTDESMVLGVTAGTYTKNDGASETNNRLTSAGASGVQGTNMLNNSGLEGSIGTSDYRWIHTGDGSMALKASTETASDTTANVTPRTGNYLLKLYANGGASTRSSAYQQVHLTKDKTYVFSAYVNTASVTAFGAGGEAYLSVQSVNDYEWVRSEVINYRTNTKINNGWVRLEVAFTPTYSGTFRPSVNLKNTVNSVIAVDDLQMEMVPDTTLGAAEAGAASTANLLQSGSFDSMGLTNVWLNSSMVSTWWTYDATQACPANTERRSGYSMTFAGSTWSKRRASQTVKINGSSNTTYLLSGWGKTPASAIGDGSDLTGDNSEDKRFFGMIAKILYSDTTTPEYQYVSFNDDYSGWQYAVGTIVPKRPDKTITSITVILACDYCPNRAYIDDVALIEEPVQTYTYNEEGKLTISAQTENDKSTYEYDTSDRLIGYKSIAGVAYTLTYSGTSRDPATITSDGVTTAYTYNSNGSVTKTKVTNSGASRFIQSTAAFSADGNYKTSTMDGNGVSASYTYNNKGQLSTTTTSNTKTTYTYDTADRPATTTTKDNAVLSYTYTEGTLSQLTRKTSYLSANQWQAYSFTLNDWGRSTAIGVKKSTDGSAWSDGMTLAEYSYGDNNGNLTQLTYSNGQFVKYTYDILDRLVKEEYYNSGETTPYAANTYVYNSQGALARQYRTENGTVTESYSFEYDSLGRLIRSRETNGDSLAQRTEHLYDKANRLTKQNWIVGSTLFSEEYTYDADDGSLTKVNTPGVGSVAYSYDSLKILYKQLYTTKTGATFGKYYGQAVVASTGQTAPRVQSMAYRSGSTTSGAMLAGYTYSYDGDGNIKQITDMSTGKVIATYGYDSQNQLTDEYLYKADGTANGHYQYSYDTAGNLQRVSVDSTIPVAVYKYGSSQWVDMLTEYEGKKIAYEGQTYNSTANTVTGTAISGNPINWYNGTAYTGLTWKNGRQLASIRKGTATYTYTYDMNGIRSSKTVNGVKHNYIAQDGKVVREEYGTTVLEFVYDTNGAPYALRYSSDSGKNWMTYYYVLNLQGDVVKLLYADGTVRAEYTYNAWGEILTKTNPSSSTVNIQDINPLRYRGYYYDTETGFYYLQSRYYDPVVKRFINADEFASTGKGILGTNMFAYCNNNPVNQSDPTGYFITEFINSVVNAVKECVENVANVASNATVPPDYVPSNSTTQNCYSYAFGLPYAANPGDYTPGAYDYMFDNKAMYSVDEIAAYVERDMAALGIPTRRVNSPSEKTADEYIIALKTSNIIIPGLGFADYHFAIQLCNGTWADKPGGLPSRWGALDGTATTWDSLGISDYYNSDTVYFAVRK